MISSRVTLRLTLGVLCAVALVLIPSFFSAQTPPQTGSNWSPGPAFVQRYNQTSAQRALPLAPATLGLTTPTVLSFVAIILFIILPSTVFSLAVRRWAAKRAGHKG